MAKYRKKPIEIEAITFDELVEFCSRQDNGFNSVMNIYNGQHIAKKDEDTYLVSTLEGDMEFRRSNMLITGVNGEIYPCDIDVFEKSYDKVDEEMVVVFPASKKDWLEELKEDWK